MCNLKFIFCRERRSQSGINFEEFPWVRAHIQRQDELESHSEERTEVEPESHIEETEESVNSIRKDLPTGPVCIFNANALWPLDVLGFEVASIYKPFSAFWFMEWVIPCICGWSGFDAKEALNTIIGIYDLLWYLRLVLLLHSEVIVEIIDDLHSEEVFDNVQGTRYENDDEVKDDGDSEGDCKL